MSEDSQIPEDEIDLADLAAVLYRNRYLIVVGTFLVALAAAGYSWLQPKEYQASTSLEIGQKLVDGTYQNVESPGAIRNRYEHAASSLTRTFEGKGPEGGLLFSPSKDLAIETPEEGNILGIELTAPQNSAAVGFLDALNQEVIKAHERIFSQEKADLRNQIRRLELDIKRTDNQVAEKERLFRIKKIEQKNKISRIQGEISNLETRQGTLREQLELLEEEKANLDQRIEGTQARYQQLSDSKRAADQSASAQEAIGLMLFSNEILRVQRYLEDLRNRSLFEIPNQKAKYQADLKEIGTKVQNKKANLDQARTELEQLDAELQSEIENLEAEKDEKLLQIEALNSQLSNMIVTQVTADPQLSDQPVNNQLKLYTALGLVLGAFLSVFLAFLREFWTNNRDRIRRVE